MSGAQQQQMAFCHECGIEVRPLMAPDPTCPRCNGSFVEIIEHGGASQPHDFDPPPVPGFGPEGGGRADLGSLLSAMLTGVAGVQRPPRSPTSPQTSPPQDGYQRRSGSSSFGPFGVQWNVQYGSGGSDPYQHLSQQQQQQQQQQQPQPPPSLSNFLQFAFGPDAQRSAGDDHDDGMGGAGGAADGRRFNHDNQGAHYHQPPPSQTAADGSADMSAELAGLRGLFAGLFGGEAAGGGTLLDLLGNAGGANRGQWGDYVVGQQGLDDIISQIMEQTQGSSGPPPAEQREIDRLERFTLADTTRVRKAKNQECPTCKDDFFPDTPDDDDDQQHELISMPCGHIFHVDCLVPWLQRHGTCPVCRVSIAKAADEASPSEQRTDGQGSSWPAPPAPFASLFNTSSVPGSFPSDSPHFHPHSNTSTTVTSTVYTSPTLSPSGAGIGNQTQVVNSIVSSPPLVSDRDEYFSGESSPPPDEIRDRTRRAAEARAQQPWGAHLEPDELD